MSGTPPKPMQLPAPDRPAQLPLFDVDPLQPVGARLRGRRLFQIGPAKGSLPGGVLFAPVSLALPLLAAAPEPDEGKSKDEAERQYAQQWQGGGTGGLLLA